MQRRDRRRARSPEASPILIASPNRYGENQKYGYLEWTLAMDGHRNLQEVTNPRPFAGHKLKSCVFKTFVGNCQEETESAISTPGSMTERFLRRTSPRFRGYRIGQRKEFTQKIGPFQDDRETPWKSEG